MTYKILFSEMPRAVSGHAISFLYLFSFGVIFESFFVGTFFLWGCFVFDSVSFYSGGLNYRIRGGGT